MKQIPETVGDHIRLILKERHGNLSRAALALGLSPAYLSGVVNGHKRPSTKLLDSIGWERVVEYRLKKVEEK